MSETIKFEVVSGCEGPSLYVDDVRIAGPKPWGGGTVSYRFDVRVDRLLGGIEDFKRRLRSKTGGDAA
ncbi:hypothetical protein [Gordonibacter massiliensis (ex Traore et al. 2017)]|uniref:hypothetical protein n=1 Tax=Gordonibacter massiliensis (ex Traore et al. 2017) TaxID=1841863 RepID=UPI001C8B698F|nr:hypothetical protein [Gordonibacter massiliensis (ex Traore et al. 2017)]MBX9032655.1 hypothetical protein [Gordonibacter massiliensis (ex Traore et al. 2017)]